VHYGADKTVDERHDFPRGAVVEQYTWHPILPWASIKTVNGEPGPGSLDLQTRVPGFELIVVC